MLPSRRSIWRPLAPPLGAQSPASRCHPSERQRHRATGSRKTRRPIRRSSHPKGERDRPCRCRVVQVLERIAKRIPQFARTSIEEFDTLDGERTRSAGPSDGSSSGSRSKDRDEADVSSRCNTIIRPSILHAPQRCEAQYRDNLSEGRLYFASNGKRSPPLEVAIHTWRHHQELPRSAG